MSAIGHLLKFNPAIEVVVRNYVLKSSLAAKDLIRGIAGCHAQFSSIGCFPSQSPRAIEPRQPILCRLRSSWGASALQPSAKAAFFANASHPSGSRNARYSIRRERTYSLTVNDFA